MRRIASLLRYLPNDCAVRASAGLSAWTPEMALLADLWLAITGERHPNAPDPVPVRDPLATDRLLKQRRLRRERELERLRSAEEV